MHGIKWSSVLIAESIKWLNLSPLPKQPGLEFLWKQQQQRDCRSKDLVTGACWRFWYIWIFCRTNTTNNKCEIGSSRNCASLVPRSAEEFRNLTLLVRWELSSSISLWNLDCGLYNMFYFLSLQEGHCYQSLLWFPSTFSGLFEEELMLLRVWSLTVAFLAFQGWTWWSWLSFPALRIPWSSEGRYSKDTWR